MSARRRPPDHPRCGQRLAADFTTRPRRHGRAPDARLAGDAGRAPDARGRPVRARTPRHRLARRGRRTDRRSGDGAAHDFIGLPLARRHEVWRRALRVLAPQSTYAAALVAQHALTAYRRYRQDPEWAGLLRRDGPGPRPAGTAPRPGPTARPAASWTRRAPIGCSSSPTTAACRLGDVASLLICNDWHAGAGAGGVAPPSSPAARSS